VLMGDVIDDFHLHFMIVHWFSLIHFFIVLIFVFQYKQYHNTGRISKRMVVNFETNLVFNRFKLDSLFQMTLVRLLPLGG